MTATTDRWVAAGGDANKLSLYKTIGSMAVFANGDSRCMAGVHPDLPHIGAVGDWVGDASVRLAAESWLRAQGCSTARGPMELCTWFPYRANLGPDREPTFAMEPTETADRWLAAGYEQATHYASAFIHHNTQIQKAYDPAAKLAMRGWRVESLEADANGGLSEGRFREVVGIVHRTSTLAFADAYGFAPIPEEALQSLYAPYRAFIDPAYLMIAFAPDGQVGGFAFALPDFLNPGLNRLLVKTLAVIPKYQGIGLGLWLVGTVHKTAADRGLDTAIHCLMWSDSRSVGLTREGDRIIRRYGLFEKPL